MNLPDISQEIRLKYLAKMSLCSTGDNECDHGSADSILLEFIREIGFPALADEYDKVDDKCGGFWYA